MFDYLFVKFYNNYCHTGNLTSFRLTLDKWFSFAQASIRPLIFVGLPADAHASSSSNYYRPPSELQSIYEVCSLKFIYFLVMLNCVKGSQIVCQTPVEMIVSG